MTWTCPLCGSDDLFVYYSERRYAPIDQTITTEPMPDVTNAEFSDGPLYLNIVCNNCGESNLTATLTDQPTTQPREDT